MKSLTRRELLKLMGAATATAVLAPRAFGKGTGSGTLTYGLFFGEDAVEEMRRLFNHDPQFAELREQLTQYDFAEEHRYLREDVRYNDQLIALRRIGPIAEDMAFLYLMTGSAEAEKLAKAIIRTIMKFERWDFFMEGDKPMGMQAASSSIIAVTLVSDWLGDRVDEEERKEWIRTMGERACEPNYINLYGIRNPRDVVGWHIDKTSSFFEHRPDNRTDMNRRPEITENTNLRAVPASALTQGALTYRLEFGNSADAERWLEMGIFSIKVFSDVYKADGSYDEGVNYGGYTTLHLLQAVLLLKRHGGPDLTELLNWKGFVNFLQNMSMPTNDDPYNIVNFCDAGNKKGPGFKPPERTAVPYWVAAKMRDEQAQWFGSHRSGKHNLWSVIWYDPKVKETPPPQGPHMWVSDLDWVVARTGWMEDDLVVAMRSGAPANHEHADRNSIIVKCFGEILVDDPLRPPYSFTDPAWRMRLTEGHSAVLIDGKGHEYHNGVEGTNASRSFARIVHDEAGEDYALWTSNCTQPYRLVDAAIKSVMRSVAVLYDKGVVVVIDRVKKYEEASTVEARFFGYNPDDQCRFTVHAEGFMTERPGAVMGGTVYSNVPARAETGQLPIPEETAVEHPFVAVKTEASTEVLLVTALALGRTRRELASIAYEPTADGVRVNVEGRVVNVSGDTVSVG